MQQGQKAKNQLNHKTQQNNQSTQQPSWKSKSVINKWHEMYVVSVYKHALDVQGEKANGERQPLERCLGFFHVAGSAVKEKQY